MRKIVFLPLGIFDSYVSLIQNKNKFGTICRISNLTNLAVTSWAFSCLLSPGLWYVRRGIVWYDVTIPVICQPISGRRSHPKKN